MVTAVLALTGACDRDSSAGQAGARSSGSSGSSGSSTTRSAGDAVFGRIPDVVREVEPSVVAVLTDRGEGSGVVWDAKGTVVTNHHVIAGVGTIEVGFADGKRAPATLVASDPLTDLAVLDADRDDLPEASFARELPEIGELAIAMGNPLGFENTVTAGIVSGLHRAIPGSATSTQALIDLVQTDAAISPGNSGGALVDADGRVIGINVAYIPPEARAVSIGFAIPSPTVIEVVGQLIEDGSVSHAFFGVLPTRLTPQIARRLGVDADAGVVVLEVVPGGPADAAGVHPGDVITSVEGEPVETVEEFLTSLRDRDPGEQVTVEVARGSDDLELTVILTDRPTAPE